MFKCTFTLMDVDTDNCLDQFAHLCNDEGLLVECVAHANRSLDHYGVPGSPVWYEYDVKDIDFEINGVSVKSDDVPDELYELAHDEAIENGEWE